MPSGAPKIVNQYRKAKRVLAHLDTLTQRADWTAGPLTPELLTVASPKLWEMIGEAAGEHHAPSLEVRALIIELVAERQHAAVASS